MNKYNVGDFILAKIRGHPIWPAVIDQIEHKGKTNIYKVTFYGTKQTGSCRLSEISSYIENKYKLAKGKIMDNTDYVLALKEIESDIRRKQSPLGSSPGLNKNSVKNQLSQTSTPISNERCKQGDKPPPQTPQNPTVVTDKAVNTPRYFDLKFQVTALTDKCLELENIIGEKDQIILTLKKKNSEYQQDSVLKNDFQTQILLQELKSCQLEIENLNAIVKVLEKDKEILENNISELKSQQPNCTHCFPFIEIPHNSSSGRFSRVQGDNLNPSQNLRINCNNPFAILSENDNHSTDCDVHLHLEQRSTNLSKKMTISESVQKNTLFKKNRSKDDSNDPTDRRSQLVIMSDSHGRDLNSIVQPRSFANVTSYVRPGAKFGAVVEDVSQISDGLTKEDHLLVMAGTNNMETDDVNYLIEAFQKLFNSNSTTNLVLTTVPMRHDKPELDIKIATFNAKLEQLSLKFPDKFKLLSLHTLPRHYYTLHGLHFNRKGKNKIGEMIVKMLLEQKQTARITSTVEGGNVSLQGMEASTPTPGPSTPEQADPQSIQQTSTRGISATEEDMGHLTDEYSNDVLLHSPPQDHFLLSSRSDQQPATLVVPGILTFSEALKQSSESDGESSRAVSAKISYNKEVESPALPLNSLVPQYTTIK